MSLEQILDMLTSFGLKRTDAQVYIFLAKRTTQGQRLIQSASATKATALPLLKMSQKQKTH